MSQSPIQHSDREVIAKQEIGQTNISRGMCLVLTVVFLGVITGVPVVQQTREWLASRAKGKSEWPQAFAIFGAIPEACQAFVKADQDGWLDRIFSANGVLLRAITSYETELEDRSFLSEYFIPRMQDVTARWAGLGNEQAYLGRDGWLFYRPGVDYLTGPGFLNPAFQRRRALSGDASMGTAVQPDPVLAIADFKTQLAARNIHLILMPIPVKGVVEPERLSGRFDSKPLAAVQNPSYDEFLARMKEVDVDVLDVTEALIENKQKSGRSQFLKTDTHWTPEGMELAASLLAEKIKSLEVVSRMPVPELGRGQQAIEGRGDIVAMLKLPENSTLYPAQSVKIQPVLQAVNTTWAPDPSSEVLVLGDSFANIYSLDAMGWGASSGLVEQLSYLLQHPVDTILRNDAGAHATRDLLSKELAQGKDRLAGKKVVVWEFAMRELAVGDWKILPRPEVPNADVENVPSSQGGGFFVPDAGQVVEVEGTVQSRSSVPRPGTVPYKDQVFAVHLTGLTGRNIPSQAQAVVYLFGMTDNSPSAASEWKVGGRVKVKLQSWDDVASEYERFNRSELEDSDLQLEPPSWGEPLP
ncbi:MAG: hypothetical protein WEB60_14980 [Terrimicrobiaceae bacterium]